MLNYKQSGRSGISLVVSLLTLLVVAAIAAWVLPAIVGPLVLGWIAGQYGYHAPMLLTAGMIVVSGALFWLLAPEIHQRAARVHATA